MGVGFQKPLWIMFLVVKETRGRFMGPRPRVGGFFRSKGGIKNGRCVPSVLGEGSGISFRRSSTAKARSGHLGLAGLARRQRHKMAEAPLQAGAAPRGAAWGGWGKKGSVVRGFFFTRCV